MQRLRIPALCLTLALTSIGAADAIDDAVKNAVKKYQIPGVAIAVVQNGKVVKQVNAGVANIQWQVPVRRETKFELASVSKQFAAVLALMLVDDKKLSLEDPLSKFFPSAPASWANVQVQHLINHSAGLPEFAVVPPRYSSLSFFPYTRAQQLEDTFKMTPAFPAGTKFQYSNVGYQLLGHVIEAAGGAPFPEQVERRILTPLGMTSSGFINRSAVVPMLADQYTIRDNKFARWSIAEAMGSFDFNAFGGLYSTIDDLAKWETGIAQRKLLAPATWERAMTPFLTNSGKLPNAAVPYAAGWTVVKSGGGRTGFHTGHTGTAIARNFDTGLSVIMLSNLGIGNPKPFGNDRGFPVTEFTLELFALAEKKYSKQQ
jgi:CubicO group peptidase (beta-lactamase class C family)